MTILKERMLTVLQARQTQDRLFLTQFLILLQHTQEKKKCKSVYFPVPQDDERNRLLKELGHSNHETLLGFCIIGI